jgi:hypothetical protein
LVALAERDFLRLHTGIRPESSPLLNLLSASREKPAFSVRIWSAPCLVPPEGVRQTVSRRARLIPSGGDEPSGTVAARATGKMSHGLSLAEVQVTANRGRVHEGADCRR